jgi:hypothetical protein
MKFSDLLHAVGVGAVLLAASGAAVAATKCPAIDLALVNKGFAEGAPWRVMSAGTGECSFSGADTSINLGFSHMVSESAEKATASAISMQEAVAPTSRVEPLPVLGEHGFSYSMKGDAGKVNETSMFFYGHRGPVGVSGYLNLRTPITAAQRDLAANLIAQTLAVASKPKALAKESNCPYFDSALIARLLPAGDVVISMPNANMCIVSAAGTVITLSVTKGAQATQAATNMLQGNGCSVDPQPRLGKTAGLLHHCSAGNPRAEVIFADSSRMFDLTFVPTAEPTQEQRATLLELAQFAGAQK